PHFGAYDWKSHDADRTNGYLEHAAHYARVAGSHPSVIAYATSHNATGYSEDMNPDRIDGLGERRDDWSRTNAELALRAQALITRADPSRLVYHHSSGNLGSMHTVNFYPNWAPVQELDDWFEHWATEGVKPVFLCEYGAPFGWDWTLYRGWYKGKRTFGSAVVPWDYCLAEWNAQFLGAAAFRSSEREAENIRWEAAQFRAGRLWHRWDYPYQVGERRIEEMEPVQSLYTVANWRAFRTWGLSANSPWEHHRFWRLRDGVDRGRRELPVDWEALQRPGFSPDFIDQQYERMDLAFEPADWIPTATATALIRNNGPLLAYIAGEAAHFTGKSHNFLPGETVEKQLVLINNSRETVACHCAWSLDLPAPLAGNARVEALPTGEQQRIPLRFVLPEDLAPRTYTLSATVRFDTGETQEDAFALDVLPAPPPVPPMTDVALLDPEGDTARLLAALGVSARPVGPGDDLAGVRVLILGRRALRVDGPGPDLAPVRDGLRVIVFEQRADVLEGRLGFRIAEYGLRQVFPRVPDHPLLAGLGPEHLRDWRGEATLLPPRLGYEPGGPYSGAPTVRWCGLEVPRLWRCGCRGSVASVLIEKPARGDFLPICDGGFSLQYSPLLEYREGRGMILFCQMDVTARSESDPAADTLVRNILRYADTWRPHPVRQVVHAGAVDGLHHLAYAGIAVQPYDGGAIPPDRILIVGAGAPAVPARGDVSAFLDGGGRLLALGLDAGAVDAFLPGAIRTEPGEHIATWFEPFPSGSPLAGISPADVHNRDPRTLPLVVGGATPFGNGVLAGDRDGDTVYCQLTPYRMASPPAGAEESPRPRETDAPPPTTALTEHHPLRRTYRRASYLLTRLLANMGAPCHTPLLSRFGTPPRSGEVESVLRNGRFDTDADGDGMPDHWEFSADAEGAACTLEAGGPDPESRALRLDCAGFGAKGKGSVMLAQHGVPVIEGQWYRIALRARGTGFGNGMVTVALQDTTAWKALLEYQRFCPSPAWKEVEFLAQARGTATERTRFQIWHGSTGTLWLEDVRLTPCDPPETGRWNEGLYVDQAREWDDPYRFFRW
ncbi:MAG: hypothetical protein JXR77_06395, partial [Lentisphaeria bacterium]|nr:hypothetical protein [Lentisphaeria bacterium]